MSPFIKNSIFGNNRDPWREVAETREREVEEIKEREVEFKKEEKVVGIKEGIVVEIKERKVAEGKVVGVEVKEGVVKGDPSSLEGGSKGGGAEGKLEQEYDCLCLRSVRITSSAALTP